MNFSSALVLLKQGFKVGRKFWEPEGAYIRLQSPDAKSKMTRPYFFIASKDVTVPYVFSHSDLLAEDWERI